MTRIFFTVALLVALATPARTSQAAIAFDSASRAASTTTGTTSISWSHTIGGGTDRFLLVGIAVEDVSTTDANITSVTYNGVALTAVPGSKISGGGTGIIQTQMFYGFGTSLGAAGAHTVTVSFQGVVDVVGSGNSGSFTPGSGQTERNDIAASGMTGATSSKPVATAGATTMSWTHSGANRLAHSLVSLASSSGG